MQKYTVAGNCATVFNQVAVCVLNFVKSTLGFREVNRWRGVVSAVAGGRVSIYASHSHLHEKSIRRATGSKRKLWVDQAAFTF